VANRDQHEAIWTHKAKIETENQILRLEQEEEAMVEKMRQTLAKQ
jgi:hypothetical protein